MASTPDSLTRGAKELFYLAQILMYRHNLHDWNLCNGGNDPAPSRVYTDGRCDSDMKTIYLDFESVSRRSEEERRDVVLHEIAHALSNGMHGDEWAEIAKRIGMRPSAIQHDQFVASLYEKKDVSS